MKLQVRFPAVLGTAVVAGVFACAVAALMAADFIGRGNYELFDTTEYLTLKQQLQQDPQNAELRESMRQLDLRLRASYFQHRRFMMTGCYLLIGGVVVCVVASRWAAALRPKLPHPTGEQEEPDTREQSWGRWAAAVVVGAALMWMTGYAIWGGSILPASTEIVADATGSADQSGEPSTAGSDQGVAVQPADGSQPDATGADDSPQAAATAPIELPDYEAYLTQWPRFRGPTGSGSTALTDIPRQWDAASGENILWKTPIPLPGLNSPVVWEDRVFVTGATADEQAVFCFLAGNGELAWRLDVPLELGGAELKVADYTGYAAPTAATNGVHLFAMFASGNLAAADMQGQLLWRKELGVPKNPYGHASSLLTFQDLVIAQYDQGLARNGLSKLIAWRAATGELAWEVNREVSVSWATPIVVQHEGQYLLITCADPWVIAYDPADGRELWRAECIGGEVGPSPTYHDGVVYVANEMSGMYAIRVDGEGDVTATHVEWFTDYNVPDVCSPLITDQLVFLLSYGILAGFEPGKSEDVEEPREPLWEEELESTISSSPAQAGELLYLFTEEGQTFLLKPTADACERVAELNLGESCRTSPAFLPSRIYIRGEEHLFCIGQ